MPKVSVIVPAYNRAKLLSRALESIFAQTFNDYEVIVVDDGSKDETPEVIKQFAGRVKYIRKENGGSASARNRGIEESKGEYIAFLDSDDTWVPEKLEEQVKVLDAHKNVGIVYARMPIINEKGERVGTKPAGISGRNFKELIEHWGDLPTSTVMARRECFQKAGMFDTALTTMQDIDMWIRISRHFELYEIENKVLAYYYRHDEQITQNRLKLYEGRVAIFKKILNNSQGERLPEAFLRRLAVEQYVLSRIYYEQGNYPKAWANVREVFSRYPLMGVLFIEPQDSFFTKIMKLIKPFGYIVVCSLKNKNKKEL